MDEVKMNKVQNLPVLEEVPEGATLIAEVDGEFYRVKGEGVGGMPEGGAPNQQLVTDADGVAKWEEKLFYDKRNVVSGEVLIPQTTLAAIPDGDVMPGFESLMAMPIPINQKHDWDGYLVIWNGKEYPFHKYDWHLSGSGSGAINMYGNASIVSGTEIIPEQFPDTGEPFLLVMTGGQASFVSAADPIDGTVVELHAGKLTGVVKSISPKYIPEIVLPSSTYGSTKRFQITVDDSGTITATEVM
jgi:hypothetical protein